MPPIRNLDCLRCPLARSVGIGAGPVTHDNLDRGMVREPCCQGFTRAVGQQIDPASAFQITQDRAVTAAFAPRPVIDAEHTWLG